jgi:hypothetical protein
MVLLPCAGQAVMDSSGSLNKGSLFRFYRLNLNSETVIA